MYYKLTATVKLSVRTMSCIRRILAYHKRALRLPKYCARADLCSATIVCHEPTRYYARYAGSRRGGQPSKKVRKPSREEMFAKQMTQSTLAVPPRNEENITIGEELTGKRLTMVEIRRILNDYSSQPHLDELAAENGLSGGIHKMALTNFCNTCVKTDLSVELYVIMADILDGKDHVDSIFPYYLEHARNIYPFLDSMEDMKQITDLTEPALWYPDARKIKRKIIMHVGPTNSGKTYHALQRLMEAESGVYCGPLRLLAMEIYHKCNEHGTPCDLVTGEDRRYAIDKENPANHVSCTVEMSNTSKKYAVAVIDEIQMAGDMQRGFAWTRALLGIAAEEVHVCGEPSTVSLVKDLMVFTGDEVEVKTYERLTSLSVQDKPLGSLDNVQTGDCIVCFSRDDIFSVSRQLEARGHEVAVIYGALPPATKLAQAKRFNDPDSSCKILVATDAIGMGLNLSIRRVIFYALQKMSMNLDGETVVQPISKSLLLQIGGRAGRFRTQFSEGFMTAFKPSDMQKLQNIYKEQIKPISKAGLNPTLEQLQLFSYHMPKASLHELIELFTEICSVDNSSYFMCSLDVMKELARSIEHIELPMETLYSLCCAPVNVNDDMMKTMFIKMARGLSSGIPMTYTWLSSKLGLPIRVPKTLEDLLYLESVCSVLDLYLWLGQRFERMFLYTDLVLEMETELEEAIQEGLRTITNLSKSPKGGTPQNMEFNQGRQTTYFTQQSSPRTTSYEPKHSSIELENVLPKIYKPSTTYKEIEEDIEEGEIDDLFPVPSQSSATVDTGVQTSDQGINGVQDLDSVKEVGLTGGIDAEFVDAEKQQSDTAVITGEARDMEVKAGSGVAVIGVDVKSIQDEVLEDHVAEDKTVDFEELDNKKIKLIESPLMANSFINDFTKRSEDISKQFKLHAQYLSSIVDSEIYYSASLLDTTDAAASSSSDTTTSSLFGNGNRDIYNLVNVSEKAEAEYDINNIHGVKPASELSMQLDKIVEGNKGKRVTRTGSFGSSGKLADTFIEQGVLSKERLEALRAEWASELNSDTDEESIKT